MQNNIYGKSKDIKMVQKGWGFERWIVNREYCGKELFFFAGKRCSFHYHKIKHETFLINSGQFEIRYFLPSLYSSTDDPGCMWWESSLWQNYNPTNLYMHSKRIILNPGEVFNIPIGLIHQMIAIGDSKIIEFSTHHEDSDSYRLIKGD